MRYCPHCREDWPATTEFWHRDTKRPGGFSSWCKACRLEAEKRRRADQRSAIGYAITRPRPRSDARHRVFEDGLRRRCPQCRRWLLLTDGHWHRNRNDARGYANRCRVCTNRIQNERRAAERAAKG